MPLSQYQLFYGMSVYNVSCFQRIYNEKSFSKFATFMLFCSYVICTSISPYLLFSKFKRHNENLFPKLCFKKIISKLFLFNNFRIISVLYIRFKQRFRSSHCWNFFTKIFFVFWTLSKYDVHTSQVYIVYHFYQIINNTCGWIYTFLKKLSDIKKIGIFIRPSITLCGLFFSWYKAELCRIYSENHVFIIKLPDRWI